MIQRELRYIATAFMFYSRIPVPKAGSYFEDDLNHSTKYLPLIGIVVGSFVSLVYWLSNQLFPPSFSVVLSMVAGILLTGSFHEDGFADVCDGFGGGWTVEDRLRIMKDSRIGTYGTIGIFFILLSKFTILCELVNLNLALILISAHSFSRLMPVFVVLTGTYARMDATSKVKPMGKKISLPEFAVSLIISMLPLILLPDPGFLSITILPILLTLWLKSYFRKRIDGFTGDCLGTIQQISELSIYISFYLLYKYPLWKLLLSGIQNWI